MDTPYYESIIKSRIEKMGDVISFEFQGSSQETRFDSDNGKSLFVTVKYKVNYSLGGNYEEQFKFVTNQNHTDSLVHVKFSSNKYIEQ